MALHVANIQRFTSYKTFAILTGNKRYSVVVILRGLVIFLAFKQGPDQIFCVGQLAMDKFPSVFCILIDFLCEKLWGVEFAAVNRKNRYSHNHFGFFIVISIEFLIHF